MFIRSSKVVIVSVAVENAKNQRKNEKRMRVEAKSGGESLEKLTKFVTDSVRDCVTEMSVTQFGSSHSRSLPSWNQIGIY